MVSFSGLGREREAERHADRMMRMLADAAERLGLRDGAAWCSDYGLGFAYAHVIEGQLQARAGFWLGWFWQPGIPSDALQQRLVPELLARHMGIPQNEARNQYERTIQIAKAPGMGGDQESGQPSEFETGIADANRILRRLLNDALDDDPAGQRVRGFEQDFSALLRQNLLNRAIAARFFPKFYPYLVARTLGERAFGKVFSAEELASRLP
ncbi:MAG: hypothetical protein K0R83_2895 [Caulobacter sp.]|jgi:hypothetical protein|nr:hypothetical protein [Caulobacter sp.]